MSPKASRAYAHARFASALVAMAAMFAGLSIKVNVAGDVEV